MSKPLIVIETTDGEKWEVFEDGSYRAPKSIKKITMNVPVGSKLNSEVLKAAEEANKKYKKTGRAF
jgi:hypothetical protein